MATIEDKLKTNIVKASSEALNIVTEGIKDPDVSNKNVGLAMRLLIQGIKIMQLNQVKDLSDRTFSLRILKWLPDDKTRQKYIEATNPTIAPLLQSRPRK
jgi:hypothetical protein